MAKSPANMAASVRQRLLNLAKKEQQVFDVVLVAYGLERLVHRLAQSEYRDRFVLKGGLLVTLWTVDFNSGRFTRDADFLGMGSADEDSLKEAFTEILKIESDDGLVFDTAELTAAAIREDQIYGGMRLKTKAYLEKTVINITIDIGFGDAMAQPEHTIDYPSLLDHTTTTIRAYSPATVIAEKFQAVVALGEVNGRMKDFYDLWAIPQAQEISDEDLAAAIEATFKRRETDIPTECPVAFTTAFTQDTDKLAQWRAYAATIDIDETELSELTETIWQRLDPICKRLTTQT